MLESQDFQAGLWVVLHLAFSWFVKCSLQSCPRSASEGEPRLSRRAEAWPFSIPSPGLRLQAGAVQSGLGLLTELASTSRSGSALAEFLFLRRVPALFSQIFWRRTQIPFLTQEVYYHVFLFISFCVGNSRITWPTRTNGPSRRQSKCSCAASNNIGHDYCLLINTPHSSVGVAENVEFTYFIGGRKANISGPTDTRAISRSMKQNGGTLNELLEFWKFKKIQCSQKTSEFWFIGKRFKNPRKLR